MAPFVAERGLSLDELMAAVKGPLTKSVGKRGGAVVDANLGLIRAAYEELIDVTGPLRRDAAPVDSETAPQLMEVGA